MRKLQSDLDARAETLSIENLVKQVNRGQVRVPSFQRGLRWEAQDVVDLFDSIYRGYPIGSLLLNKAEAPAGDISIGIFTIIAPKNSEALWVVDGQQRITALTCALSRPTPIPKTPDDVWVVYFDALEQTFHSPPKDGQIPSYWVPVAELLNAAKLSEWVHQWEEAGDAIARTTVFEAGARIRQYQIPLYIVETDDDSFLRDIFHRINNYGKNLRWAEIHNAIYGQKGDEPTTLGELADELTNAGMGTLDEQQILTCLLGFKGLDVTRSFVEHYRRDQKVLQDAVKDALPTMRRVLSFFSSYAEILHLRLLPRSTPLPVLTRFFALHPEPKDRTLRLLVRWTWRALLGKALFDERTLLRRAVSAINKEDEEGSIQALLKLVPNQTASEFAIPTQFDARSADSRVALLGLIALKPLDLYDGKPIDVAALIEESETAAFRKIVPTSKDLGRSPANRIFAPGSGVARREIVEQLNSIWSTEELNRKIWNSHAITEKAVIALDENRIDDFLEERKKTLESSVRNFTMRLAAWGQSDRPSIEYLINESEATQ